MAMNMQQLVSFVVPELDAAAHNGSAFELEAREILRRIEALEGDTDLALDLLRYVQVCAELRLKGTPIIKYAR